MFNFFDKFRILKRKYKSKKISYSYGGVDLIVNYILKNKKNGFYIDVGAQHPIENNNTYILHKKGWRGINIDLDKRNIRLFNNVRSEDINLNFAVSSMETEQELYFYHDGSPINTLEKKVADYQRAKIKETKKISTTTLNKILKNYKIPVVDYLNIDVEGHEIDVLRGFDIKSYSPQVVSVEFLDLNQPNLEIKNNNIDRVLSSDIYKYMIKNDYDFVNWSHADLIFVNKNIKD